jgi:O-antigen ligase
MPVTTTMQARFAALDRLRLAQVADWLAVGVAVSLPWSTSVTAILITLWVVAVAPTLDLASVRRELASAAGGLPVLLWGAGALGMLWADVAWSERLGGLGGFNKLLIIPLVLARFRRSEHGMRVLQGFLWSMTAVLAASWALTLVPGLPWHGRMPGVPVKDYIIQSEEFLICGFALLDLALDRARARRWPAAAWLCAFAAAFIVNILFVAAGRTTLVIAPVLALLLGWRHDRWRGAAVAAIAIGVIGGAVALASPYLDARVKTSIDDLQSYQASDTATSTGLHMEFLRKSLSFVETSPIIGHGTGSIPEQFRNAASGGNGASAATSANPHNQIFAVAIQIGLVGVAVLVAMWIAHALLFRGGGLAAWIGCLVVVENVVASPFNSHLFDFTQGWLYVFGVGVAGGLVLRERANGEPNQRAGMTVAGAQHSANFHSA